jgi:formate hydrogenlyase subunit 3/multisubunit Na+/H+ antiporter MnhD subunit
MPAVYSATPNALAAAIAGGTISVRIVGLVRFGVGTSAGGLLPGVWMAVGVAGAAFGVVRGLVRREPERILAFSTVSQMGMALGVLGFAARSGTPAPVVIAAVAVFLFHHALAKTSLFLGVGAVREGVTVGGRPDHPMILAMLFLPALALAGLPLTSGAVAKGALAEAIATPGLDTFLLAASAGTTALMLHFVATLRDMALSGARRRRRERPHMGPWVASVVAVASATWLWPDFRLPVTHALRPDTMLHAVPPLLIGAMVWVLVRGVGWKGTRHTSVTERAARTLTIRWDAWTVRNREVRPRLRHLPADVRRRARHLGIAVEGAVELLDSRVGTWTLTGTLFVVLLLALRLAL